MLLEGKKGLVLNVTNERSIGWAIADLANQQGATVGLGAQNDRLKEKVDKLVEGRTGFDIFTIDFLFEEQFGLLREQVEAKYGQLDFLVHSAGFAPKPAMDGRFLDTTLEDFNVAMNASAYSFVRMVKEFEPLMKEDSSIVALSYLGSTRVAPNYNVMGMCKAALESAVRYTAFELGDRGIRVNTVSPGPVRTLAGSGVKGLRDMISHVHDTAPLKRPYAQPEAASTALYLLSDLSKGVTGQIVFVDSGYNTVAI